MSVGITVVKEWLEAGSINIFGLPWAGKDEQAKNLADLLDGYPVSGGQIMRDHASPEAREQINQGKLAPTGEYLDTVCEYLHSPHLQGKPLVYSALGRWHGEEQRIVDASKSSGHPLKAVILLIISEETARQRLASKGVRAGRQDDDPTKLPVRFEEFRTKTVPVLDYYRDKLLVLDGSASIGEVTSRLLDRLSRFAVYREPDELPDEWLQSRSE